MATTALFSVSPRVLVNLSLTLAMAGCTNCANAARLGRSHRTALLFRHASPDAHRHHPRRLWNEARRGSAGPADRSRACIGRNRSSPRSGNRTRPRAGGRSPRPPLRDSRARLKAELPSRCRFRTQRQPHGGTHDSSRITGKPRHRTSTRCGQRLNTASHGVYSDKPVFVVIQLRRTSDSPPRIAMASRRVLHP